MKKSSTVHITPRKDGDWNVIRENAKRPTAVVSTQDKGIDVGRAIAKQEQGQLKIHGRDNLIREERTYRKDPHPPKG